MRYDQEVIMAAQSLWVRGNTAKEITSKLGLNDPRIVYYWAEKNNWSDLQEVLTPQQSAAKRFNLLINTDNKTTAQLKEIELLTKILCSFESVKFQNKKNAQGNHSQSNDPPKRERKKKEKKPKNDVSHITEDMFKEVRESLFFEYQLHLHKNKDQRTRFILKSRQIGLTFYFSFEAIEDAILNGKNQVFLSASKKQAFIFKAYILMFVREHFDIELKGGETITLSNGAQLNFISTNSSTSQGYSGNLYVDEVFWIPNFKKLDSVAKPIASQKKWRRTYLSTASVKEHGAYAMWSGDQFKQNAKRKADKEAVFDISHEALKDGALGADGIWRQIITIHDAAKKGCNLFNIKELESEYSNMEWCNLFLCQFMDQSTSIFNMLDLIACGVDADLLWRDFNPNDERPMGNHPIWLGYDPARFGDQSTVVALAPPMKPNGSFRVVEKMQVYGSYPNQAAQIKPLFEKYNVEYMGIDRTGQGQGVCEEIQKFSPRAEGIYYTQERKVALVLKAQSVITLRRMEWSFEDKELAQAFIQIKQVIKNDKIFYEADRNSKTGHADYAMAIMNALANEPLAGKVKKSSLSIQE